MVFLFMFLTGDNARFILALLKISCQEPDCTCPRSHESGPILQRASGARSYD
jgi:hypothetical protein